MKTDNTERRKKRPFMHSRYPVLLFDGVCNFCNDTVNTLIKLDRKGVIRYAPLQSETGQNMLDAFGYDGEQLSSLVLIADGNLYTKSDATFQIAKHLGGLWHLFRIFKIVPRPIRNGVYDWIARNRYKSFGKKDSCMIPTPDVRGRFLV
jgi:predicted DCC family thiol-disulfide oxidoreductase YuxK